MPSPRSTIDLTFQPPVIAHRGVRAEAPENTLPAFGLAKHRGATWIETDVKLTHDGIPILMHDDTLERTTNGNGAVADIPWELVRNLDAGTWFDPRFAGTRVPRMSEMLKLAFTDYLRVNLEIKPCPNRTQATTMVALIEAAKLWPADHPPPLISSFDVEALVIASQLHPEWPRGLLLDNWRSDWAELAKLTRASTINLDHKLLTGDRLDMLLSAGLPILTYTVNDPARAKELLQKGVAAVFTDDPAKIIKAL